MGEAATMRRGQGVLLLPPSARTIRWGSFPVIAGVAALAVWTGGRKGASPANFALPVATALLCIWLCFLFDDPASETTDGSATPLLLRRGVRAAIAIPAVASAWFACTWIGSLSGPTRAMAMSFGALVLVALGSAAGAARIVGGPRSGLLAAGVVVFVALVMPVAAGRPPSVDPSLPPWGGPTAYWGAVAVLAGGILILAHRDPARPLPRPHLRRW
jgi:hypothetical protein